MANFHHVNIRPQDPAASLRFYRALGIDVVGCMRMPGMHTIYLGSPGDSSVVELSVKEEADPNWSTATGSGHFAFTVTDLHGAVARLEGMGIRPEGPPFHPGGRPEVLVAFFGDPDGNRVELIDGAFPVPQDDLPEYAR
ncbi:VOC family protein [Herbidospora sp. RD11066]